MNSFVESYFGDFVPDQELSVEENAVIAQCTKYVSLRFSKMKYILGTALDFTLLSQLLSKYDADAKRFRNGLTIDTIFVSYQLIKVRGQAGANTLTVEYQGQKFGIRKIEENVLALFMNLKRSKYPSSYVYNTGQWQKYQDLLELCFKLSETGRFIVVNELIRFGLSTLSANTFYVRSASRIHIFPQLITNFPRGIKGENGGLIYQAIAFGYVMADRPYLSILADKVRTGSSRQKRFGDIDCYNGLDLELSVEVKDFKIEAFNVTKELGRFVDEITGNQVVGVAFIKDASEEVIDYLADNSVGVITQNDLLAQVSLWDWQKQEKALQGVLHYIAHIEQDVNAVKRLLAYIKDLDATHSSLAFL